MKLNKKDQYSPNYILGTLIVTGFFIVMLCGSSLWIPASRIGNLYLRAVVLTATDAASAFSSSTGLDIWVPRLRSDFLSASGLSGHESWDTRYYNRRNNSAEPSSLTEHVASGASTDTGAAASVTATPSVSSSTQDPSESISPADLQAVSISGGGSGKVVSVAASFAVPSAGSAAAGVPSVPSFVQSPHATSLVHSDQNPLKVFMFGDSQVFSLGSGLSRLAGKDSSVNVDFLAIHSSGFVRGDYYNWSAKLADTFRQNSYDAAVMMLGMNDYQSFWNNKGEIMKKGTPEWEAAYKEKCRAIVDEVLSSVPRLYWIGLPVVKNNVFNSNLAYINSVQESLALEYSPDVLVRVSLREIFPGKDKPYTDTIETGTGKPLHMMNADGSHFTVEGGQVAMVPLFDRLAHDYLFSSAPVAHLLE